jgi:two-component system cell cycle response regulator DivK
VSTILVVDDHPLNLELITDILEASGYRVIPAMTGEDAMVAVLVDRPDLVLMDIALPGMDGHTAVRRLKADPRTGSIPVIAVTSFAMAGDKERALASGFDGYLSKPIETRALTEVVARFLDQAPPA